MPEKNKKTLSCVCYNLMMTHEFSPSFYPGKKRNINILPSILLVILLCAGAIFLVRIFKKPENATVLSPVAGEQGLERFFPFMAKKKDPLELKKQIEGEVGTTWNNYSVLVLDLTSDFTVAINDEVMYSAASVNKVPILAALYHLAGNNEVDLDTVITLQESDVQDYGTGSIRYDPPGSTYSLQTLARLMITKSDNTAAYILGRQIIGLNRVQKLVNSWGLTETNMETNKTSNKDIGYLFKKIYDREITTQALTLEMLSFLKDTDFEDRLPALLPENLTVYHKIGTEVGITHDVGIVKSDTCVYYIGILTSGMPDEKTSADLMARISKLVYEFMK